MRQGSRCGILEPCPREGPMYQKVFDRLLFVIVVFGWVYGAVVESVRQRLDKDPPPLV